MCNSTNPTFPKIQLSSDRFSKMKTYAKTVNKTLSHKDIDYLKNCYSTILSNSKYRNQGDVTFLHPVAHLFYELTPYDIKSVRNYGKILNNIDYEECIKFFNTTCYLNNKKNYNCKVEISKILFKEGKRNESIYILEECISMNKKVINRLCFIEIIHQYKLINNNKQNKKLIELIQKVINERKTIENDIDIIASIVEYYISIYDFTNAKKVLSYFKYNKNKNKVYSRILSFTSSYIFFLFFLLFN